VTTVAILPVKRFDRAKSRLGAVAAAEAGGAVRAGAAAGASGAARAGAPAAPLGASDRASLAAAMLARVLDALAAARRLDAVLVVTGEPAARDAARERGFEVVDEPVLVGHNGAAELGIARAVELGAARALLVPGDCPLLSAEEVDGLLDRHPGPGVVVVPDRHRTGTNALLLAPPDAIRPSFGPGSFERHLGLAPGAAVEEVPGLLLDVDTQEDLDAVHEAQR
jgi:2-phospho-L-lactate guanylyltransferase